MKTLLSLITFLSFTLFAQAQHDLPPNAEPGKCYAKCLIVPQVIKTVHEYPVYSGSDPESVALESLEIVTQKASTKWEKKGEGNQAVWCLVEVPRVTKSLMVVKDIEQTQDYEMTSITTIEQSNNGEKQIEWREVICNDKVNKKLVSQIQLSLQSAGYYDGKIKGKLNSSTKSALTAYQKDNGLPVGNLDVETMEKILKTD